MKRERNTERQEELDRDYASRFVAEQYHSKGYFLHFHRNMEIYGVIRGRVAISINGESKELYDGQIAIIDSLENHSYTIDDEAEIIYAHIGTKYLKEFLVLYPNQRLPHWLLEEKQNKPIYQCITKIRDAAEDNASELRRIGLACELLSTIIECYGVVNKQSNAKNDNEMVTEIVQYIYDHYNEDISLESLSKHFFVSPKALSKKLTKRLHVDLRVFINDVRVQKAVQMIEDPAYKGKSINDIAASCGFKNMGTFYRSYERNFKFNKNRIG